VVVVDGDASWTRRLVRQGVFVNRHRGWIDARDLVGAELDEEWHAAGADDHAVRIRAWRRRRDDLHVAGLWIEAADHVRTLHGEPERSLLVEDRRIWIPRAGRQLILADRTHLRS